MRSDKKPKGFWLFTCFMMLALVGMVGLLTPYSGYALTCVICGWLGCILVLFYKKVS